MMKTVLMLLGAAAIGLMGGGIAGYTTGLPVGAGAGMLKGICEVTDAAVLAKVLTVDQATQLGKAIPQKFSANEVANFTKNMPDVGEGCKRSLKGVPQGS
jgi:hypothetical protein